MAGKRIRKECIHPSENKKAKREVMEDDLENLFSLLSHSGTLEAGKLFSMKGVKFVLYIYIYIYIYIYFY